MLHVITYARVMKKQNTPTLLALGIITGLSLSTSAQAVILFADNFDRADNNDLNASATGKSGSLGALNWEERSSGGVANIESNRLQIGEAGGGGGGWAIAYPDHNFTDASISSTGSFTVSLDLIGPIGSGGGTRFTGFAVGNSLAEVNGWSSNNPTTTFTSDFFFGYDTTGTNEVKVFKNGTTQDYQQSINLDAGATLSATFSGITDFNSGSTVNYEVFINGGSVNTGSFIWSGTNDNYIAVYSNYTTNGTPVDNFSISDPSVVTAIPEPSSTALLGLAGITLLIRRRK